MIANDHARWGEEIAAYALDALDADEAQAVEAHLAECERCRADLRWLEPSVDVLAESVVQVSPPPRLRSELIATTQAEAGSAAQTEWRRSWRAWVLQPAVVVAVAAVVVAGGAGYAVQGDDGGDPAATELALDAAPGADGAVAVLERHPISASLRVSNVPPIEGDGVYQVWIQRGDEVTPSATFRPDASGSAETAIVADLDGVDAVMVTREPEPGRTEPTLPALFETDLD